MTKKKSPSPVVAEPTCVGVRASTGDVCGSLNVRSRKYQLCNTCYSRAVRKTKGRPDGYLSKLKVYRKEGYGKRTKAKAGVQSKAKKLEPQFEGEDDSTVKALKGNQAFAYGKFDVSGMESWEKSFVFSRKRDIAVAFDDPTSKGIAHRWILSELQLERLRRKSNDYQAAEDFIKSGLVLTQIDKMEKTVQGLQKELNFLPSQTEDDKKTEEIFSNMQINYRKHKARLVAGFDDEEIELMAKKGMNVELERTRIAEITGRLSMDRARSLLISYMDAILDVARDVFHIDDEQAVDLTERISVRVKTKVPEITALID